MPKLPAQLAPRLLTTLYGAGALALALSCVRLWRTYCENFGCIGVGIAWFAWALGYALLVVAGLFALRLQRGTVRAVVRIALVVQALSGVFLLGYWAVRTAG